MTYKRVTPEERIHIYHWRQEELSIREIGRRLRRPPSTISRELNRNTGQKGYRPKQANDRAVERSKRAGERIFLDPIKEKVIKHLHAGWTPEIITQRTRKNGQTMVCKETIYKFIYRDSKNDGDLWLCLPRSHRKRRRRCPKLDNRGRGVIPNQKRIDTRPSEVETRELPGHWEGDLINGAHGTGNLVTLVERTTRFTLVGRTDTKESSEVFECMNQLLKAIPSSLRTGLTLDNGKEFALHEKLAKEINIDIYFAYPYHSWERGSNENANGLIRRLHPKKSSFSEINKDSLKAIDSYLNDRPRKCLGWKTPREVFMEYQIVV
jgi:transposase, IS30 family